MQHLSHVSLKECQVVLNIFIFQTESQLVYCVGVLRMEKSNPLRLHKCMSLRVKSERENLPEHTFE